MPGWVEQYGVHTLALYPTGTIIVTEVKDRFLVNVLGKELRREFEALPAAKEAGLRVALLQLAKGTVGAHEQLERLEAQKKKAGTVESPHTPEQ